MTEHVLALDLGTTGTRAVLFDREGTIAGFDYKEWESMHPAPAEVEQNALEWWNATRETVSNVLAKTGIDPSSVAAISVTNQRETIVPVDVDGKPLANAIVWQDRRTTAQCEAIKKAVPPEKVYSITGLTIDPYFSLSKILWFKQSRPGVHEKTHKYLLVHDFIVHCLTGEFVTDRTNASRTMLLDINTMRWSDEMAGATGIDLDVMPEVEKSGALIGKVKEGALPGLSGVPVVAGAGDQQCAALGVGVVSEGRVKCTVGTGTFLLAFTRDVKLDASRRVLCSCGAVDGTRVLEASMFSTGSLLRWARDTLGLQEVQQAKEEGRDPYQIIDDLAESVPPGARGLVMLPFLVGAGAPHWNPDARAVLFGLAAGHGRSEIYRSILEATSIDVRRNIDVFLELGVDVGELRLTGGGSRSATWNQALADACNITCLKPRHEEATSVGAALLAATGIGWHADLASAASEFIEIESRVTPRPEAVETYARVARRSSVLLELLDKADWLKR